MKDPVPPFLGSSEDEKNAVWQITGLPFDKTSSYRRGTRYGPSEIRIASDSIETFSPYCNLDLEGIQFLDTGDLEIESLETNHAVTAIAEYYRKQTDSGSKILGIGGEHTVSIGIIRGLVEAGLQPYVLQLDAHLDLREKYNEISNCHCSVARRISEMVGSDHLIQWGMRSGTGKEFEWAEQHATYYGRGREGLERVFSALIGKTVYLTLDLDVFDPSEIPGVGNPEPGGWHYAEFLDILPDLGKLDIIGTDVVELSPVWDTTGRSSVITAEIIRELLLTIIK
jgi:agmatinase